jgi:hypothetical protein
MADSSPPDFSHIPWRRLKRTEQRGKQTRPIVPPQPPLRSNAASHRQQVSQQAGKAVDELVQRRKSLGVEPQHLLVLEMEFVQAGQRELLERIGARILDEGEKRVALPQPVYCVPITFDSAQRRQAFEGLDKLASLGITEVRRDRGTHGAPHDLRLIACFESLQDAKAFHGNTKLHEEQHFKVGKSGPKKESKEIRHSWLVEFPDLATAESFRGNAVRGQSARTGIGKLSASDRANLFDAVDEIRALNPGDRRGSRLAEEGVPDAEVFAIDVDLWHPADPSQMAKEIKEFRELVARFGGKVTDGPTPVADTLFIARVKGTEKTLDAILNYDRVAYADLPPKLPPMPSTIFKKVPPPEDGIPRPTDDAPLACLVDSGVLATHPLLSGWVPDERDFDSGDNTVVDQVGHGTHLAGIIVYGDVFRCLERESWDPKVRVLSAKVLKNDGGYAAFPEDNDERVETQLARAIETFNEEYGCRVFNLSVGHLNRPYLGGRQHPWALVLDELARRLDIVLVVAAGNVSSPEVPDVATEDQLRRGVLEQLLGDDHAILDPGCSMLSLTVGSIARLERTFKRYGEEGNRPPLVGSPPFGPSPFTRAGRIASTGAGPAKAVKPDLVAFGGNYFLDGPGTWHDNDALMGEPSLNMKYRDTGRLLKAATGTSVAAPFVTHVCARIEHALSSLPRWRDTPPTANLVRALAVHSAVIPKKAAEWVGASRGDIERRLRLLGYGKPNPARALRSTDQRVVLLAEDELEDEHYHVYELDIPAAFCKLKSKRHVRITLAYDPPVRGTRKEYLVRKLYFRLVKDRTIDEIDNLARQGKDCPQPTLRPSIDWVKDSTVQSTVFDGKLPRSFNWDGKEDSFTRWYVIVRSEPRLESEELPQQRYSLVVSLEHSEKSVQIYTKVRNRVNVRVRQNWG